MRLTVCALSAVLLSGCAWPSGFNFGKKQNYYASAPSHYQAANNKRCVIQTVAQPVPSGCHPSEVVLVGRSNPYGAFPQKPTFGQPSGGQYATKGFGSHASKAHQQGANYKSEKPKIRKPKLRGSLNLGMEKSIGGIALDYPVLPGIDPVAGYNPDDYNEGFTSGSVASGQIQQTVYSAIVEKSDAPSISFDDIHSTPVTVSGGLEYIASPHFTVFANAGYTASEGEEGDVARIQGEVRRTVTTQDFDTTTGAAIGGPISNIGYLPNQEIASFAYSFDDLRRWDLEVGGRYYFNPIVKDQGYRTVTPFVSASVGAKHYNDLGYTVSQRQGFYEQIFDRSTDDPYYDVIRTDPKVTLYESQWVPTGALQAGVEWQLTPSMAMAMETGLRFEGSREYANGTDGDENLSIPLTLRGSFNF